MFIGIRFAKNKAVIKMIRIFWSATFLKSSLLKMIAAQMESGARILPNRVMSAITIKELD